jgi:hypothetical protein
MQFMYGPWMPDAGEMEPGICMIADGVLPKSVGYGPSPSLNVDSGAGALADDPRGAISLVLSDGSWKVYAGTDGDIYSLDSGYEWDSLGGTFNVTDGDDWSFLHFGSYLLATNTTDGLQSYNVETPAGFTAISDAGDPAEIFTCANMVFGLDCLDGDGNRNNRLIKNSDFNSFTNWTSGAADEQPLEGGGKLLRGFDLSDGAAFILQDRATRLIQFGDAGGGALYSLRTVSEGVGAVGKRCCVGYQGAVYWIATDGFRRFTLGGGIETIGAGQVDEWFFDHVDQSALDLVQGQIDPFAKMVWWRYKAQGAASDTIFEDLIGYSWQWKRWVTSTVQTTYLANIATPATVLDDITGLVDDFDVPLDSRIFQGGQPLFGALNGDRKFGTFSGTPLAAQLQTGTSNSPVTGLIGWATPIDDCATGTLELGVKAQPSDSITWKTGAAKVGSGRVPLRGRGKNIAFRRNFPAGATWTYARGVDHVAASTGGPR